MKKLVFLLALLALGCVSAQAQNWTSITAANVIWTDGTRVNGTMCFTPTDAAGTPISFRVGGGGQVVGKPACQTLVNGVLTGTLQVPNPCSTAPKNIRYRIEVTDAAGNHLKYEKVSFCGGSFNFDTYVPSTVNLPPSGASVATLAVGHLDVLQDCSGCSSLAGFHSFMSINIPNPEIADSGLIQAQSNLFHYQISGISCTTDQGTVTVNLEIRTNANVSGTPVLVTPLVCSPSGASAGAMTPVVVPVANPVAVIITAVGGTPSILRLHVQTTY